MKRYDVIVLGGGPAGLAASISASKEHASVLLIEREAKMGGILKQCIHDGFGLLRFGERLTGPEYADRFLKELLQMEIDYRTSAFVLNAEKLPGGGFRLEIQTQDGILYEECNALVLACGCREKTARQVWIHGDRPAGVYTAGTAQHFVNLMGCMPTKKCVILGSGDIGMIMARRLTLEGAEVEGVYEIKNAPAGLARNVAQCLNDYNIPLHLSTTVTRVIGTKRVEAVEVCQVDEQMQPIAGTERIIDCDALILSVGLLPENEIAEQLGVALDPATKGPYVDQRLMTSVPGVFCCGNALHVNDLVDYVSESGELAGKAAAHYTPADRCRVRLSYRKGDFLYVVPQYYDMEQPGAFTVYFRSRIDRRSQSVTLLVNDKVGKKKNYLRLLPSEMETLTVTPKEKVRSLQLKMEARQ
ncbi:MAG: NAD(P)/FAD-dependent oxidoreductase [Candidatus Fimivicinus sp.]|nr:NAD(P)/FAD-dependent oxidoreductase [Oscillospiraceae bacterium]MDY5590438.1 NAD(P)/FAD-dependent oxidoreductase [Candidatus Fimivicinus sp.]